MRLSVCKSTTFAAVRSPIRSSLAGARSGSQMKIANFSASCAVFNFAVKNSTRTTRDQPPSQRKLFNSKTVFAPSPRRWFSNSSPPGGDQPPFQPSPEQLENFRAADEMIAKHIATLESNGNATRSVAVSIPSSHERFAFLDVLSKYYDCKHASVFQEMFGQLSLGKNPTPLHSKFRVMRVEFANISSESFEKFEQTMSDTIRKSIDQFTQHYEIKLSNLPENAVDAFVSLCKNINEDGGAPLFLIWEDFDLAIRKLAGNSPSSVPDQFQNFYSALRTAHQESKEMRLLIVS